MQGQKSIIVRFNPEPSATGIALDYTIELDETKTKWAGHPKADIDISAISINPSVLIEQSRRFAYFHSDDNILCIKDMAEQKVSEGDFVYALGFPMNLVDLDRQYVISKAGTIARIRDVLEGYRNDFIVDISLFPGNSGSPVVSKPEMVCIEGTKSLMTSYLIGIVKANIPYSDIAVSQQTRQPRVIFQENSGLAIVIPVDFIMETIDLCYEKVFAAQQKHGQSTG